MKNILLIISVFFISSSLMALDGKSSPQGSTIPSSTGIMGGGTPGRDDDNRMSKQMYNYEEEEESRELEEQEDKSRDKKEEKSKAVE